MNHDTYTIRQVGTTGHEILTPGGEVIAWTVDEHWAALIAALLNKTEQPTRNLLIIRDFSGKM